MAILNTLESTDLDETIRCASKWFILAQKRINLELVNLKCVNYVQPIPLSLTDKITLVHLFILLFFCNILISSKPKHTAKINM